MKYLKLALLAGLACASFSCSKDSENREAGGKHTVGFSVRENGNAATRTSLNSDGLTMSWTHGDRIAVWAKNPEGALILDRTVFSNVRNFDDDNVRGGVFTAQLSSAMPEDDYIYYAAYPVPDAVSGTAVTFTIPSVQDGKVSGGADILVASPVEHGALGEALTIADCTNLGMEMRHLLHHFRLYIPEDEGISTDETPDRLILTFSRDIAGKLTADYTDPDAGTSLSEGTKSIRIKLADGLQPSSSSEKNYAALALFPFTADADETFSIEAYSASNSSTKVYTCDPVSLRGRTFEKGHSTPVKLFFSSARDKAALKFTLSENNLGESPNSITVTAPSGCVWECTGTNIFSYNPGREIATGESFTLYFGDTEAYRAFSGKNMTVTFDSEHATITRTVTVPNLSSDLSATVSLSMPYLLYEDFSSVGSFSSHDEYSMSNAGSKGATSFLNGWTGGRIGAEAGKCIRIAARRETSANYPARVDSAPIISLKKSANIKVSYDYGANNKYYTLITKGDYGQNVSIGYVTDTKGYESGASDGTFSDTFYIKEYTGSYTNLPNHRETVISSVPTGTVRITWRSDVEHQPGTNNTTCWLYIDNVKVQIAK